MDVELELEMKKEHAWTTAFFDYCTDEYSFIELHCWHDRQPNNEARCLMALQKRHSPMLTDAAQSPWFSLAVCLRRPSLGELFNDARSFWISNRCCDPRSGCRECVGVTVARI
jgi:hypothetical protein